MFARTVTCKARGLEQQSRALGRGYLLALGTLLYGHWELAFLRARDGAVILWLLLVADLTVLELRRCSLAR